MVLSSSLYSPEPETPLLWLNYDQLVKRGSFCQTGASRIACHGCTGHTNRNSDHVTASCVPCRAHVMGFIWSIFGYHPGRGQYATLV